MWFIFKSQVTPPAHRRPANVWNFPNGREKLKHLADQPPCLCGAGRYALAFCFYKFNVLLSQRGGGWVVENHSIGKHPFQGGVSTVVLPLVTSGCLLASVACVQFYLTLLLCEQLSFFLFSFFMQGYIIFIWCWFFRKERPGFSWETIDHTWFRKKPRFGGKQTTGNSDEKQTWR